MVFKSLTLFARNKGPDEFWRKRRILRMTAVSCFFYCSLDYLTKHVFLSRFSTSKTGNKIVTDWLSGVLVVLCNMQLWGGFWKNMTWKRFELWTNCSNSLHLYLKFCVLIFEIYRFLLVFEWLLWFQLWQTRLEGVCQEHGISEKILLDGLAKCNIFLNRKSLSDLAIWEPRSFKSLLDLATARSKADGLNSIRNLDPPAHVITRGMLR